MVAHFSVLPRTEFRFPQPGVIITATARMCHHQVRWLLAPLLKHLKKIYLFMKGVFICETDRGTEKLPSASCLLQRAQELCLGPAEFKMLEL